MEIDSQHKQGKPTVAILRPQGRIDGSNYQDLVAQVSGLYANGVRRLLLDLSGVNFLSSAGLVALHTIVLVIRGEKTSKEQTGWDALAEAARDAETGPQQLVKLLNPQTKVANTLEMSGLDHFFEIYNDEATALTSFN